MAKKPNSHHLFSSPLFSAFKTVKTNTWKAEFDAIIAAQGKQADHVLLDKAFELYERFPTVPEVQNLAATFLAKVGYKPKAHEIWQSIVNKDTQVLANLAAVRMELDWLDEITENYFIEALKLDPKNIDGLYHYGIFKERSLKNSEAVAIYKKLVEIAPQNVKAMTNLLFTLYFSYPLPLQEIFEHSQAFAKLYQLKHKLAPALRPSNPQKSLRIGILSADVRNHPVGYFFESLISASASRQYEWLVYANTAVHNELSERVSHYTKKWYKNVHTLNDEQLIKQIRVDDVDILLDLTGYSGNHRLSVFAAQAAPVQITWLGYWGTTALPTMQAMIADKYCMREGEEKWFTEKVYRMPHTRLCMMPPTAKVQVNDLPALKNGYPTFGCFQKTKKMNDSVLQLWAKIAKLIPQAKWHFQTESLAENKPERNILRQKLLALGFKDSQLSFAGKVEREDYFKSYHDIDYILDVFPYTGGTTTTEALWMGVPTISLSEQGVIARQGEQLLSVAGLSDWVCETEQAYIDKALYWSKAENYDKLNQLRLGLRQQVLASPLFDTEQFAQDWCALVRQIWVDECNKH